MLAVDNLGKRFGNRWIFRGLSFTVGAGDRLVILGHNGSGKSTLLRCLSGLLPPTEGRVGFPDGDLRTMLGVSALDMAVYPALTVAEHLELTGDLRGCPSRTSELLTEVGLDAADVPAGQLSSGMRARLKLAIAIQADPAILILDEPGASLDERGRALVESVVRRQSERGCCIIATNDPLERRLATHELELVG